MASKFQTRVIKHYREQGYMVINLIKTNKNGIADLLCLKEGKRPLFIECKEERDTVKPLQVYRGKEVMRHGADFKILRNVKRSKQ